MKVFSVHKRPFACCLLPIACLLTGCGISKSSFSPNKKYSLQQVQQDYFVYQNVLEKHHPSISFDNSLIEEI